MSFNFKEAQDVIKETLGDNYASVQSKIDKIIEVATSQKTDLSNVTQESMKRKGKIAELNIEHEKTYSEMQEKISKFDTLETSLSELKSQLENSNNELKSVYDDKKSRLKELSTKIDFKDEKFKSISSRFKGLDNIDELSNQNVNELLGNFELLNVNNNVPAQNTPHPSQKNSPSANPYSLVPKA